MCAFYLSYYLPTGVTGFYVQFVYYIKSALGSDCIFVGMYVSLLYVCEFSNSSKTRPNSDSKIENEVHMNMVIGLVHWLSDHVFMSGVSARQEHMKPALACVSTL
jgi:hypothetical protein